MDMVGWRRSIYSAALTGLLTGGSALAADQPDDILALVVRNQFNGQPGLYLETKRSVAAIEKFGRVDLFCSDDGPGWAIIRFGGRLIAINGTGKTWARNGMQAFLRNGSTQTVVPADEARDVDLPDTMGTISAARAPCAEREARGVEQTVNRMRDAAARFAASGNRYR